MFRNMSTTGWCGRARTHKGAELGMYLSCVDEEGSEVTADTRDSDGELRCGIGARRSRLSGLRKRGGDGRKGDVASMTARGLRRKYGEGWRTRMQWSERDDYRIERIGVSAGRRACDRSRTRGRRGSASGAEFGDRRVAERAARYPVGAVARHALEGLGGPRRMIDTRDGHQLDDGGSACVGCVGGEQLTALTGERVLSIGVWELWERARTLRYDSGQWISEERRSCERREKRKTISHSWQRGVGDAEYTRQADGVRWEGARSALQRGGFYGCA
nr:hypothetical protein Iba_chr02bCG11100 [Ipomoea batatas]